jgi:hypothetical protein
VTMRQYLPLMLFIITTGCTSGLLYAQDYDTTLINNQKKFYIKTEPISDELSLLTATSETKRIIIDTIEKQELGYIEYPDFNNDGNADILVDYRANNITQYLYLFDPATNRFRKIPGSEDFPQATQLTSDPNYYYSYHRAGCADMNWVSDLFTIRDFHIIQIGHIEGDGCDADPENEHQEIKIFRIADNNEDHQKLIKRLPYEKYIPEFGYKWVFIKKYWNKNYEKFK